MITPAVHQPVGASAIEVALSGSKRIATSDERFVAGPDALRPRRRRGLATPRYAALYNFDVLFTGQRGPVGMKLETNGATTRYYTGTPEEGAWSFVTPDAS